MELKLDKMLDEELLEIESRLNMYRKYSTKTYFKKRKEMCDEFHSECEIEENKFLHDAQHEVTECEKERMQLMKKYGLFRRPSIYIEQVIKRDHLDDLAAAFEKCRVARHELDKKIDELEVIMIKKKTDYRIRKFLLHQEHKVELESINQIQVSVAKERNCRALMKFGMYQH